MRRVVILVLALGLVAPGAFAGSLADMHMDDEVMVGEKTLMLNGMGLRKKAIFKIYVAGLYLEHVTTDATNAATSKQVKKMVMHFMTNKASKKKMDSAWSEGFEANASNYAQLKDRVEVFMGFFGDMKDEDIVEMTLIPGEGTSVVINGVAKGTIEGDDFSEALVSVWVGDEPPSDDFKAGLLGG